MWGSAELATLELSDALFRLRDPKFSEVENALLYQAAIRLRKDHQALDFAVLLEALDSHCMWINPDMFFQAADEIDCCGDGVSSCENTWWESDTNAGGCHAEEEGKYCPFVVAETLRNIGKCAQAAAKSAALIEAAKES